LFISDELIEKINRFEENQSFDFPFYSGAKNRVNKKFGIKVLPSLIIAKNNGILHTHQGFHPDNDISTILQNEIQVLQHK
tara:strand:+ start:180 stop:419 length:240 start_codon:yes stop_codon:yes gene_type:complete